MSNQVVFFGPTENQAFISGSPFDFAQGRLYTRYALSKNIPRKGPRNCGSLGFARDDKGEVCAPICI
jgi:hypothetical protein